MKSILAVAAAATLLAACASDRSGPGAATASTNAKAAMCLLGPFMPAGTAQITRAQMEAGVAAGFAAADLNRDGGLSSDELSALNARRADCDVTPYIDYGGTGHVTLDAYAARYRTAFEQADTNTDNIATQVEIAHYYRPDTTKKKVKKPMPSATESGGIGAPGGSGGPGGY